MAESASVSLLTLPPEIVQQIFGYLPRSALRHCCLVSHWVRDHSSTVLWSTVVLTDCRRYHNESDMPKQLAAKWEEDLQQLGQSKTRESFGMDDHDDTPMIKLLYLLARSPTLAAKVNKVIHRCHLPPPSAIFELPEISIGDRLSNDWRTLTLLRLAIRNLVNVKTLRIISGHFYITTVLLREFLNPRRCKNKPIRHLWLESCNIDRALFPSLRNIPEDFDAHLNRWDPELMPRFLDLRGLESLRIRRNSVGGRDIGQMVYARFGDLIRRHDGRGSVYSTLTHTVRHESPYQPPWLCRDNFKSSLPTMELLDWNDQRLYEADNPSVAWLNDRIWTQVPEVLAFLVENIDDHCLSDYTTDHAVFQLHNELTDASERSARIVGDVPAQGGALSTIIKQSMLTLSSLNLDWLMFRRSLGPDPDLHFIYSMFSELSQLRFPNLKCFQYRNAVSSHTIPPAGVYLLNSCLVSLPNQDSGTESSSASYHINFPGFLRSHDKLVCLAWPMELFYRHDDEATADNDTALRLEQASIVSQLSTRLLSIRVDATFSTRGEPQTDNNEELSARIKRDLRRRFITDFVTQMTALTEVKLEGGIPKDEQRQILSALNQCPLRKIVQIGVNNPLGNNWGLNGSYLNEMEQIAAQYPHLLLEEEPLQELERYTNISLSREACTAAYEPVFDGAMAPPLLYIVASHFAETISELKFCGVNGAPILSRQTPITKALLHHLKHFRNLRQLAISMWLLTAFDSDWHEREIINHWFAVKQPYTIPNPRPEDWAPDYDEPPVVEESMFERRAFASRLPLREERQRCTDEVDEHAAEMNWTYDGSTTAFGSADDTATHPGVDMLMDNTTEAPQAAVTSPAPRPNTDNDDDDDLSAASTASPGALWLEERDNRAAEWVQANFHPRQMASQVTALISPHLHPHAMARRDAASPSSEQGVKVRALFSIGVEQSDIFELDVWINAKDSFCGYRGPMEEGSWVRWWEKLDGRGWFES